MEEQKNGQFNISFNSLETVPNDPTILKAKVTIFDFKKSGNNQIITKEVAEENIQTLLGKRICCKYITRQENNGMDTLGSHEQYETINRDGEDVIYTNTNAIGFIDNVYIDNYTDENGFTKEVVFGDVILWCDDHYSDIIGLLQEWMNNGVHINMSVEYYYYNYNVQDGVEYIQSPIIFNAHTLLNSEDRGNAIEVLPAYDCATLTSFNELKDQWNKALNSLNQSKNSKVDNQLTGDKQNINNDLQSDKKLDLNKINNEKEESVKMENIFRKALNDISLGDLRCKILDALGNVMTGNEYNSTYISSYGIFPEQHYFIYESYDQDNNSWNAYKVTYNVDENDNLTVDYNSRQVFVNTLIDVVQEGGEDMEDNTVENSLNAEELEKSQNALKEAEVKIEELTNEVKSLNEKLVQKSSNAQDDTDKFNDLTEKLVSMNAMISEMQPIVDKYNAEVFEKSLNEAKESYKDKFAKVNALDIFEIESTQELIKESINSDKEKAKNAKFSLNELIVNNIKIAETKVDDDDLLASTPKISVNQVNPILKENNELLDEKELALKEYGLDY